MAVVGTAELLLTLNDSMVAPELAKLDMGGLAAKGAKAGEDAGAALATGVGAGAKDLEHDLAAKGESAGTALGAGLTSKLGSLAGTIGSLTGLPLEGLTGGLDKAGKSADDLTSKTGSSMSGLAKFGGVVTVAGAALAVGIGASSIHAAEDFQSAMTRVQTQAQLTSGQAKALGDAFTATAGSTEFSATEIAQAFGPVAGQLGMLNGKALTTKQTMDVMSASMDLATATGQDLGSTTQTVAGIMQAFQVPIGQVKQTTDTLYNTARITGTSVDSLGSTFDRLKARLGVAAPSVSDMSALVADLAEHGVTGSRGLMVVNTALNSLVTPSAAVKKAQDAMGLSFFNAQGQFIGMGGVISQLQPKLAGLTEQQQLQVLQQIGLTSSAKALLPVIDGGTAAFGKASDAVSKSGTAHAAAAQQSTTLKTEERTLGATFDDIKVKVGSALIPILQTLGHVFAEVTGFVMKHKDLMIALGVVIGGILTVAVAAFALAMGRKLMGAFRDVTGAVQGFLTKIGLIPEAAATAEGAEEGMAATAETTGEASSLAFGPIGLAIMAIVAVGTLLITHWHTVERIAKEVFGAIKNVVLDVVDWIKGHWQLLLAILLAPFAPVIAVVVLFHNQIIGFIKDVVDWITDHWKLLVDILTGPIGLIITNWHAVVDFFSKAVDDIVGFFTALPGRVVGFFMDLVNKAIGFAGTLASDFVQGLENIASWFAGLPGRIMSFLGGLIQKFLDFGGHLADSFIQGIGNLGKRLWDEITSHIPGGGIIGGALHAIGLAEGGYVTQPTFAMIGEDEPEFVIPESKLARPGGPGVSPLGALGAGPGATTAVGGTNNFNVTINAGSGASAQDIVNEFGWWVKTAPVPSHP